jgi:alkanesulfonate monooxygenase SsuD/methylene tetrahydromethanopterin reductase-like flavin-dependent oxidoreductase (luciferase family)
MMVAEEHAMIDVISGGRLISGFVRGIGAEYHTFGVNPTFSHDRFHEAHDLIVRAWTEKGPFPSRVIHYRVTYVNLWPQPLQKPHPPIWIPSQGSKETIDWASHPDRRYTYLQTFSPAKVVARYLKMYRDTCKGYGYDAKDSQLGWAVPVYVGTTDESARKEAREHFETFRNVFVRMPIEMLLPPGYTSARIAEERDEGEGADVRRRHPRAGAGARVIRLRQPEDGVRDLQESLERDALRQSPRPVPVRHAARRPDAQEHGAVRARGDAAAEEARLT